jgi:hypothetical protein
VSDGVGDTPLRELTGCRQDDWLQEAADELGRPFNWDTGPFLRLVVLHGEGFTDLLLACHHAIADGMAGYFVLRDLLGELGGTRPLSDLPPETPALLDLIPPAALQILEEATSR